MVARRVRLLRKGFLPPSNDAAKVDGPASILPRDGAFCALFRARTAPVTVFKRLDGSAAKNDDDSERKGDKI